MALATLRGDGAGGIHDQLGGGFHRYSVDAAWTVPHFEKMLYDNALLARAYAARVRALRRGGASSGLRAPRSTGRCARCAGRRAASTQRSTPTPRASRARSTCGRSPSCEEALGEDAPAAIAWLGATSEGNFEDPHDPRPGLNVLSSAGPEPPAGAARAHPRAAARRARARAARPGLDDKRLTSWNALMVAALADAGAALGRAPLPGRGACVRAVHPHDAARRATAACCAPTPAVRRGSTRTSRTTRSCSRHFWRSSKRPARSAGPARGESARGHDHRALRRPRARRLLLDRERRRSADRAPQGPRGHPDPRRVPRAPRRAAAPAELTGSDEYERQALGALALVRDIAPRHPTAFGHALQAMHWHLAPMRPIACPLPAARSSPPTFRARDASLRARERWAAYGSHLRHPRGAVARRSARAALRAPPGSGRAPTA